MKNRVCELLGIKYPIIQGGMAGYSKPKLVSAVSNAGGLGLLAGATGPNALQEDIDRTRELTDKPFGVNVPLALMGSKNQAILEIALKKNIKIFVTAAGNPEQFAKTIKEDGGFLLEIIEHCVLQPKEPNGINQMILTRFADDQFLDQNPILPVLFVPNPNIQILGHTLKLHEPKYGLFFDIILS